ncbi:hypothetical protein Atai01_62220 [Amycolatopsis taiwanensis]|uniref:NAD(P)-binding domain-containing protein n=1 Tax=Amycolatopsis taiwanensis TaxID=342230 RepID=A0A9W6R5G2_9PSEU|nr:hypothetical protein Atai01_62220 [Amycolatopsis taiwanensis]
MVFGATGYIGGRLVPELVRAGHRVRAVVRNPAKLDEVPWRDRVEIVTADVRDPEVDHAVSRHHLRRHGTQHHRRRRAAAG